MKNKSTKKTRMTVTRKDPNQYPKGLKRRKVQAIIAHYENQTDDQAIAEDEAAYHSNTVTMMGVPVELVPKVQKLIARRSG
jgi:hypothetical protein